MLAGTPERLDFLKTAHARGKAARPGERVHLDRGGQAPPSADRGRAFPGRAVRPVRGPRRPVGRDPRLRQGGADGRRRDPPLHAGDRADAGAGRRLARGHARGHDQGRDRGQCRRAVGARGRPPGRARAAGARHGSTTTWSPRTCRRWRRTRRAAALHRLRGRDLYCARRARACCSAPTRRTAGPGAEHTTPRRFQPRAAGAGPRPHRAQPRGRVRSTSRRSGAPASSG